MICRILPPSAFITQICPSIRAKAIRLPSRDQLGCLPSVSNFFDEPSAGLDPIIAAGIDQLILELKQAFRMTIIVVTHELASAYLIADRMVLIDKGRVVAMGTTAEMRASTQPRVRQFLDRVPEPEVADELDYLKMLTQRRRL